MKNRFLICIFMSFLFLGCEKNISMSMQLKNDNIGSDYIYKSKSEIINQIFDDDYFELDWGNAFPIDYFSYGYKSTSLFLYQYGAKKSKINIKNVKLLIDSLNYSHTFIKDIDMKINENNDIYVIDLINCMSDILQEEEDILKFKNVDKIKITIEISNGIDEKELLFEFIPLIEKTNKILDKMMSI